MYNVILLAVRFLHLIHVEKYGDTEIISPNATDEPLILYITSVDTPDNSFCARLEHKNMLLTDVICGVKFDVID